MILRRAALLPALLLWSVPVFADAPADAPAPSASASASPSVTATAAPTAAASTAPDAADILLPVEPSATAAPLAPVPTTAAVAASAKPADSGAPAPAAAKTASSSDVNTPVLIGLIVFAISYIPCLAVGFDDGIDKGHDDSIPLVVPFAGPWITAQLTQPEDWAWGLYGSLSILQVAGAGIFTFGLLRPPDAAAKAGDKVPRSSSLRAIPVVGPGVFGLSVQGAF